MRVPLPNGDELIPDEEFAGLLAVTRRTAQSFDRKGCPYTYLGGKKFRPKNEALNWVASRIKRRNPRRTAA